jgi:plasmid stability protein
MNDKFAELVELHIEYLFSHCKNHWDALIDDHKARIRTEVALDLEELGRWPNSMGDASPLDWLAAKEAKSEQEQADKEYTEKEIDELESKHSQWARLVVQHYNKLVDESVDQFVNDGLKDGSIQVLSGEEERLHIRAMGNGTTVEEERQKSLTASVQQLANAEVPDPDFLAILKAMTEEPETELETKVVK